MFPGDDEAESLQVYVLLYQSDTEVELLCEGTEEVVRMSLSSYQRLQRRYPERYKPTR